MRTPDHTRLNLSLDKYYRPFINEYIRLLQSKLKKVEHIGHKYKYTAYTCGEPHDERNPNWKPFGLLWCRSGCKNVPKIGMKSVPPPFDQSLW